ncbi:MAG TPA: MFS transporter [Bauldia sp.]|nr:MFS transporter [Bauldia sp.]
MAFFGNDAINRVNVHTGILALAQGAGGIFFLVFLLRAGISVPHALIAQAAILGGRFLLRPAVLPLAKRVGLKPLLIAGTLGLALQYPLLATVHGVGPTLVALLVVVSLAEILYYPAYNAAFASLGDAEHRGHQIAAREAVVAIVGVVAPLLGAWALVTIGAGTTFAAVGVVQALAAVPLIGVPNVAVVDEAPGALRAARLGGILIALDGWFDALYIIIWQVALFVALGSSFTAYGGAMALAGLVGGACGLFLGRIIDSGRGRRAVAIAFTVAAALTTLRAVSLDLPWLAVIANAAGAALWPLLLPALGTATYNLAKAAPCTFRFNLVLEAGWDVGCASACLITAALVAAGVPLGWTILLALPAVAIAARLLWQYYGSRTAMVPA